MTTTTTQFEIFNRTTGRSMGVGDADAAEQAMSDLEEQAMRGGRAADFMAVLVDHGKGPLAGASCFT